MSTPVFVIGFVTMSLCQCSRPLAPAKDRLRREYRETLIAAEDQRRIYHARGAIGFLSIAYECGVASVEMHDSLRGPIYDRVSSYFNWFKPARGGRLFKEPEILALVHVLAENAFIDLVYGLLAKAHGGVVWPNGAEEKG